jgi:hypothetical protein
MVVPPGNEDIQLSMQVVDDVGQLLAHSARLVHAALFVHAYASLQQHRATQLPQVVVAAAEQRESIPPQAPAVLSTDWHLPDEQVSPVSQVPSERHEHVASPLGQSAAHPEPAPTANTVPNKANVRNRPATRLHFVHVPI